MSGKPYPDGVRQLRFAALESKKAANEIARLSEIVKDCAQQVEDLNTKKRIADSEIRRLLDQMGLSSTGNYGWENRMLWFLSELASQGEP